MTNHLSDAAESIRQHLHDRPWDEDPHLVYKAIADIQDITHRLGDVLDQADRTVRAAIASDNGHRATHSVGASRALDRTHDLLLRAAASLGKAQTAAGHLIWADPS